jgi:H+/Cl- antiporter ClcA/PII-like signaling protein
MHFRWNLREHCALGCYVAKWFAIASILGIGIGTAVALFLWCLEHAMLLRFAHPALLYGLPFGGLAIGLLYHYFGRKIENGNNLILEQIHEPGAGVPLRMAPLVLIGTVATHLFGGSAGREGTAVQMGGSLAGELGRWLRMSPQNARTLLMAGIAGGFGAVFGTPLTGAIFAMEVLAIGRMSYDAIIPCLIASIVGDCTVRLWGLGHSHYHIAALLPHGGRLALAPLNGILAFKVSIAAVAFGLASLLFAETTHRLHHTFKRFVPWPFMRPVVGGCVVIAMTLLLGTSDYLGLGTMASPNDAHAVTIQSCFTPGGATAWSWWWKILFTAVTLGCGFKGGEVTPLFFVGAALGNVLARLLGAPVDLFAGLGFVAVFAGATNTPLTCTIMGLELFLPGSTGLLDSGFVIYLALACFLAYLFSGHSGIYLSQRIGTPKIDSTEALPDISLDVARHLRPPMLPRTTRGSRPQPVLHPSLTHGEFDMTHASSVHAREVGQLRIFMMPRDRKKKKGFRGLFVKPLYQELISAAKEHGLLNAVAHRTHFGYSGQGKIQHDSLSEIPNDRLTMCVELIATRDHLESFCKQQAELLRDKVVVYEKLEHWEFGITGAVVDENGLEHEAGQNPEDIVDDVEGENDEEHEAA